MEGVGVTDTLVCLVVVIFLEFGRGPGWRYP